jgi:hypothetical protein
MNKKPLSSLEAKEAEDIFDELTKHGWVTLVRAIPGEAIPWIVYCTDSIQRRHIVHSDSIISAARFLNKEILNIDSK